MKTLADLADMCPTMYIGMRERKEKSKNTGTWNAKAFRNASPSLIMSHISRLTSFVSCLSYVSCLTPHSNASCPMPPVPRYGNMCPVSHLLTYISFSCLTFPVSHLLSYVSCLTIPVSCLLAFVSCLMSPVSCLTVLSNLSCQTPIFFLMSPVSHLLSHVSHLLSSVSYLKSLLSHILSYVPVWRHLSSFSRLLSHVPQQCLINPFVPGDFFSQISLPNLVERCIAWID